jgi:hypothetical protein
MDGVILALAQEGASIEWCNPRQWKLSVDVLWARKHCERLCGDLWAVHQKKCTLGKIETSSRLARDEITNLWVKLCNLCSVNCHDSRAHGNEWHKPFTWLVGLWLVWVWSSTGFGWFGYRGETSELCLDWLQGLDLWALFGSGYRGKTSELVVLGYSWITEVQCHA